MNATEKEAVRIAVGIFGASAASKTPIGLGVLTTMASAMANDDIKFKAISGGGLMGSEVPDGPIILDKDQISDSAMLAVWFVHEAYHRFVHKTELYIDEEINSRMVQMLLVENLTAGVVFEGKTYAITSMSVSMETMYGYYKRNQLVDLILAQPYMKEGDFLTQSWIVTHFKDFGGIGNRDRFTKRTYVKVLAGPPQPREIVSGATILFKILSQAENPAELRALINEAGEGNYDVGLTRLKGRINMALMTGGTPTDFAGSIIQWQTRTGIDLAVRLAVGR